MHIDALTILFRLTLFGLLAYKITQLVRTYVIPIILEALSEEKKQHTELFEKEKLLISTQHRLENQITQQKKTFQILEKNAHEWNQEILALQQTQERENNAITQALEEKRKIQQKNLTIAKDSMYVIPRVCSEAQQKLNDLFSGEQGEKILVTFIHQLSSTKNVPFSKN